MIKSFKFILLKNCGHTPWIEKTAKNKFWASFLLTANFVVLSLNCLQVDCEWAPLKKVVIGSGEDIVLFTRREMAKKPDPEGCFFKINSMFAAHGGKLFTDVDPEWQQRIVEQLNMLAKILADRGIIVFRNSYSPFPDEHYFDVIQKGRTLLYVRDPIFVVGNKAFESSMRIVARRKEYYWLKPIFVEALSEDNQYVAACDAKLNPGFFIEGGDVLVHNFNVYVGSGNLSDNLGIRWLQYHLGDAYHVYPVRLASGVGHLDCVLALIRPGLALLYRAGIVGDLPAPLRDFEFIELTEKEAECLGTNVLVLDEKMVIIDKQHVRIGDELRKRGQEVIEIEFDAVTSFGGSLHCVHQPLIRK